MVSLPVVDSPMVMCSVLEQVGYEVLCAGTPEEALELASERVGRIDLLLTDVVMPQMSGPALADQIVELFPEIKVVGLYQFVHLPPFYSYECS